MKSLRVIVLVHEDLVPPETLGGLDEKAVERIKTEFDVANGLRKLGHEVQVIGVSDDLMPIRRAVDGWKPQVLFNLLMEFQDVGAYQAHVVNYLELLNVPFTGCNALGIQLSRDKALAKKILRFHRIPNARFAVFPKSRVVRVRRDLRFPLIVKSVEEEASLGISQASVVSDEAKLRERVEFVHEKVGTAAIAEEYIEGREFTVSVIGNERLSTFPIWELRFENLPEGSLPIATARAKWDLKYQRKVGIKSGAAKGLEPELEARIARIAKRVYRMLELSGYARLDLRVTPENDIFVIEANATPDVCDDEDFALSAAAAGLSYPQLLQRIVKLGIAYRPRWKLD
jgi:D-alanine-D-alanine ligase